MGELRLSLVSALHSAAVDLPRAQETADAWMLAALAAEELGLGGAMGALSAATEWHFAPVHKLLGDVTRLTGLPIAPPVSVAGIARPDLQPGLPFSLFKALREGDDPFGALAQLLRTSQVALEDGSLGLVDSERRRDEGGYYTPYPLAHRLAKHAIDSLDLGASPHAPAIIDPACGAGTFLSAAFDVLWARLEELRRRHPSEEIEPVSWTVAALHGVEIDPTALLAARLSLAVRAVKAERDSGRAGQMALFGQAATYGPLILDRLRLGDSLHSAPEPTLTGTERLRRRLLARDEPGRLRSPETPEPVRWDADFPLRFSDDEGSFQDDGGFDLVLTNPPFVPVDRIEPGRRALLMKRLETAQRRFDLFIGFVERALSLLATAGRATLLIPRTFLTEANAEKCRRLLLERASIERIEELGPVAFDGARVECIALTVAARRAADTHPAEIARRGARIVVGVPQAAFRRAPRAMMRLELAEPVAAECLRLAERAVSLGRFFCASWGARGVPVRDFHLDAPSHPLARPMLKGDDVAPLSIRPSTRWLLYDPERLYRPSRREFFEAPKLVVRKVSGARGLVVAVDEGRHYTDDSLACVVRKADLISIPIAERRRHGVSIAPSQIEPSRAYDLWLVAALLQSPLVQTYYRVQLGGGLNVFPELIEALPLPRVDALGRPEAAELVRLAHRAAESGAFDAVAADALVRALFDLPAA